MTELWFPPPSTNGLAKTLIVAILIVAIFSVALKVIDIVYPDDDDDDNEVIR